MSTDDKRTDLTVLTEAQAKRILISRGIPTTVFFEASNEDEAVQLAEEIGYPVVLKLLSDKIIHKSDVGGVAIDIQDSKAVKRTSQLILERAWPIDPSAKIIVQEMVKPGIELILGMTTDAQFGPVLLLGIGGIYVEVYKDVSFGLIPIKKSDTSRMIKSLKGYSLLEGIRGKPRTNIEAIQSIMMQVSELIVEVPEILELDLNPIIVNEHRAIVVDARMVVTGGKSLSRHILQ